MVQGLVLFLFGMIVSAFGVSVAIFYGVMAFEATFTGIFLPTLAVGFGIFSLLVGIAIIGQIGEAMEGR